MDLVRPALLKQISLRLSSEGGRAIYLAQDRSNGKIFTLPAHVARAVHCMKAAATSRDSVARQAARAQMDEDSTKEAYSFLYMIQSMRKADTLQKKPFNPVFASIPLFDVGPWQHNFKSLANRLVNVWFLVAIGILGVFAIILGARNDWSIMQAFSNAFSLEALLTFGLIAPVLKVIHEFGHVLAATRYNVRVRKAGLYVIGMYPMPFVDCTEADMAARRNHRIIISCAGIVTDVIIGLLAFIAWHFTGGTYLHTLLGNIFVFSTLNSILFNANPLIKLDGYYALTDAIGKRNLYTRASAVMKDTRQWIASFGAEGARPRGLRHWGLLVYAVLAFVYRINILLVIAVALVPRYLGGGAIVAVWGAVVMFLVPAMREKPKSVAPTPAQLRRRWFWRVGLVGGLLFALFFIQAPFKTVVAVTPDGGGVYQVTIRSPGFTSAAILSRNIAVDGVLTSLENPIFIEERSMLSKQLEGAELTYETVQGDDPVKALAARKQIESLTAQRAIMDRQIAGLRHVTQQDGIFLQTKTISAGTWLGAGDAVGMFLPSTGAVLLSGPFPERYVTLFQGGVKKLTLHSGSTYFDLDPTSATIREVLQFNRETGARSWQLNFEFAQRTPAEMAGVPADVRVQFASAPLWRHLQFFGRGLLAKYREAQLLDRSGFLEE